MKKKYLVITAILLFLVAGAFVGGSVANKTLNKLKRDEEKLILQKKDLYEKEKAIKKIKKTMITPLNLTGASKNVITTSFDTKMDQYKTEESSKVAELLTAQKEKGTYTPEKPLWAYNPYGTNASSMYLYFTTEEKSYARYTVSLKKDNIPDFSRTLSNGAPKNLTKVHEYQLTGLVPGYTNYIVLTIYNKNKEVIYNSTYCVEIPDVKEKVSPILKTKKYGDKEQVSNGLFAVFSKNRAIVLYDNSGIMRGYIPTYGNQGRNLSIVYNKLIYIVGNNTVVQVNQLGQVTSDKRLSSYARLGGFSNDDKGNLYILAAQKGTANQYDYIVRYNPGLEKINRTVAMRKLLKKQYKTSALKQKWLDLKSIQVLGQGTMLVGSSSLNSIFKINCMNARKNKIEYVISNASEMNSNKKWKRQGKIIRQNKKADKYRIGKSQFVCVRDNDEDPQETVNSYSLSMVTRRKSVLWYVTYHVDENRKIMKFVSRKKLPGKRAGGNADSYENNLIYNNEAMKRFIEFNQHGKKLQTFYNRRAMLGVYKMNWNGFWYAK